MCHMHTSHAIHTLTTSSVEEQSALARTAELADLVKILSPAPRPLQHARELNREGEAAYSLP